MSNIATKEELYYPAQAGRLTDFIGFQFNGVHSSELNIVRTSDGSRYNESLISNFQDKTVQMPGSDETLYWESFYSSRSWNIEIAFDSMTEVQFRKMRQVFNAKATGELIFDETPYKAYSVKVQTPPQLKFLCFTENGQRIYKGEGTIQFISYKPYARSVYKYLDLYSNELYPNKSEWAGASGMKATQGSYDLPNTQITTLYNGGDVETDLIIFYSLSSHEDWYGSNLTLITLTDHNGNNCGTMNFSRIEQKSSDAFIRINSKTNLIEGCNSHYETTGTLYNDCLIAGDFFKLPASEYNFILTSDTPCSVVTYDYFYY